MQTDPRKLEMLPGWPEPGYAAPGLRLFQFDLLAETAKPTQ
jgi:hypothetical protein